MRRRINGCVLASVFKAPNNASEIRLVPDGFMFSPYHCVHGTLHNGLNDRNCFKMQSASTYDPHR